MIFIIVIVIAKFMILFHVDWNNTSLEQIMDAFVQEFEALQLYDDPKKLERWSVMLSEPNIGDDGSEIPNEESARFREEREILLAKIYEFISEMTKYQGKSTFYNFLRFTTKYISLLILKIRAYLTSSADIIL